MGRQGNVPRVTAHTEKQKGYFKLVFGTAVPERRMVEAALEKAHEIRQFEIRLYWQRSLFFWGFILTFFGAYMLLLSQEKPSFYMISALPIIAIIGLCASYAWLHVERGSTAWQKNWEHQIDFLENHITGKLHKTVLGEEKGFFSLATILRYFIIMLDGAWFALFGVSGYLVFESAGWDWLSCAIFTLVIICFACVIIKCITPPKWWRTSTETTLVEPPQEVLDCLDDVMFEDGEPKKFTFFQRAFPNVKRDKTKNSTRKCKFKGLTFCVNTGHIDPKGVTLFQIS